MLNSRLVSIYFYFSPPKSWTKKQKLISIGQYKRTKPDIDNLIKTVLDAANDHLWKDDTKLHTLKALKQYAEPKIIMNVEGGVNGDRKMRVKNKYFSITPDV